MSEKEKVDFKILCKYSKRYVMKQSTLDKKLIT